MRSAVYVGEQLVAPGGCPLCAGSLSAALQCQRCGARWETLGAIAEAYAMAERLAASRRLPKSCPIYCLFMLPCGRLYKVHAEPCMFAPGYIRSNGRRWRAA